MPLLAINISDNIFSTIRELVEKGSYQSPESFLEIAAFNQLALERGASPSQIIERGHRKAHQIDDSPTTNGSAETTRSKTVDVSPKRMRAGTVATPRSAVTPVARVVPPTEAPLAEGDYEAAFQRLAYQGAHLNAPKPFTLTKDANPNERIFGQVNRYLPLKIACRWLLTTAENEGQWPRYDQVSDRLADDAATIGSVLERWDAESGRKREELLATGLPRRGNSASRDRFLSQFVARVTRAGEVYPATICQYQFARFDDSGIALTERGAYFASIQNPVIDGRDKATSRTLSSSEAMFLAQHIEDWVPAERADMRIVTTAVGDGPMTPAGLAEAVRGKFPADWSESVFQTHLSGLIARLGELRLLKRLWQGRNVTYALEK